MKVPLQLSSQPINLDEGFYQSHVPNDSLNCVLVFPAASFPVSLHLFH